MKSIEQLESELDLLSDGMVESDREQLRLVLMLLGGLAGTGWIDRLVDAEGEWWSLFAGLAGRCLIDFVDAQGEWLDLGCFGAVLRNAG